MKLNRPLRKRELLQQVLQVVPLSKPSHVGSLWPSEFRQLPQPGIEKRNKKLNLVNSCNFFNFSI